MTVLNAVSGLVREALAESVAEVHPTLSQAARSAKVDELFNALSFDEALAIWEEVSR